MTNEESKDNTLLVPTFRRIWQGLQERESLKSQFHEQPSAEDNPVAYKLFNEADKIEQQVLVDLVGLLDVVLEAMKLSGQGHSRLEPIRHFAAFKVAQSLVRNSSLISSRSYVIVQGRGESGEERHLEDVVFYAELLGRTWNQTDIIFDLLQYWELTLRHQTTLDCKEFCDACRRFLSSRVINSLFRDGVTRFFRKPEQVETSGSTEHIRRLDVDRRLDKIARHLGEEERIREEFLGFTCSDGVPGSPSYERYANTSALYCDELALILSELCHLSDNVKKWLKAHKLSKYELDVVEKIVPYRVASCYVNTEKHGIHGEKKNSAVHDLTVEYYVKKPEQLATDNQLIGIEPLINYNGEAWQATELIADLMQLWELFLRNHTDIDTTVFRRALSSRLMAKQSHSAYVLELPAGLESHLSEQALDRENIRG